MLVGGLGFAFTLRAALDAVPHRARVVVSEVSQAMVDWNRTYVGHLTESPLEDPRVEVVVCDILRYVRKERGAFDAILLDVDDGPFAMARDDNQALYGLVGLATSAPRSSPGAASPSGPPAPQGVFWVSSARQASYPPSRSRRRETSHFYWRLLK